jgi:hypothetical protein
MKYLVVARTETNGGDYLIAKKLLEIIEHEKIGHEIVYKSGLEQFSTDFVKTFDRVLIGGGPLYENRLLSSNAFPLLDIVNDLSIPTDIVGAGWYGDDWQSDTIYNYKFNYYTLNILNKIVANGGTLGCRDYITSRVLKNNDLGNVIMTGCPVWYDYNNLDSVCINSSVNKEISNIIISDPGVTKKEDTHNLKAEQTISVVKLLQELFPHANIRFTFNNGILTKYSTPCNKKIKSFLDSQKIESIDLSNNWEGFQFYDSIDLHVGYRVHSHIYSLSKRIPSILIQEDARGYGVNHALGLSDQLNSLDISNKHKQEIHPNEYLIPDLKNQISEMIDSDFIKLKNSFRVMKESYSNIIDILN